MLIQITIINMVYGNYSAYKRCCFVQNKLALKLATTTTNNNNDDEK